MRVIYKMKTHPECHRDAVVQGSNYRFTVLTSKLIRLEYNSKGLFEDRATQTVLNRNFPVPQFEIIDKENSLEIITDDVHMIYNKGKFTKSGLSFQVRGNVTNYHSIWHFGEETTDLKGTTRTLDHADGEIPLEHGLISKNGFSVIDDSHSLIISKDGWVVPRNEETIDFYFLGYGHSYQECLKDFYTLCGKTPLLPRYTLGNWWSRYHKYTETEYKELMKRFEKEQIPFSIAVIDMDWHLVDIDPKFGSGWTGYTWNKDFFPDPEGFMNWLHKNHMKITLNVHPADGVRSFEDNYIKMAKALGINYEKGEK
ncbi:TIM-barrel domain-containing protein [Clostridium pasteurianum]